MSTLTTDRLSHDDAERHVLGSLMHSRAAIEDCAALLDPGDFHAPKHEIIYATILAMTTRGDGVDPMTVAAELTRTGQLATIGGPLYLADLYAAPATSSNAAYYARIVRNQAVLRRLHAAGTRITQLAAASEGDVDELVEHARTEVDAVSRATAETGWVGTDLDETLDALERPTPTVHTPWPDLDHLIGGWAPGRLYVVGARPAIGKTLVALNAAEAIARTAPVALNTLEMSRSEIHHRLLANLASVPMDHLDRHALTEHDWSRIAAKRAEIGGLLLSIDDRSAVTATDVVSHARTVARRHDGRLGAVIVDYLQLMQAPTRTRGVSREQEVAGFSRRLKVLARELSCPVIALSQLNRGSESRTDRRPTMADLRESGALEQDADVVLLLHVEEDAPDVLQMAVAKNRHGPTGAIELERQGALARITPKQWRPSNYGTN